jgi:pimeloyl-ACP methyl ester carboxylesterase
MARRSRVVEDSAVRIDGPWTHRDVGANGIRLHLVELGTGPLVVLLHGFPQFWWAWRHQLVALADAGYRAVAADLRGYGASDKPPRGYDSLTSAADIAGLVRALGESGAVVVGHGWGGQVGWTLAARHPDVVRKLVVLSAPHPLQWPGALLRDPSQRAASGYVARFQLPWHPERWLVEDDAANVTRIIRRWAGPAFPLEETERRWREAMLIMGAPHCALEYYRWAVRSTVRADGRRYRSVMRTPVRAPTLQLHGDADRCVRPHTAQGAGRYVEADYQWRSLDGVGHFPADEAPDLVSGAIVEWCKQ